MICPKCSKSISFLNYEINYRRFGEFDGGFRELDIDTSEQTYVCPECGEILALNEKKANDLITNN